MFQQYKLKEPYFCLDDNVPLSKFIEDQTNTAPQITIKCKALKPKPTWKFWQSKEVIARDEKIFEYENWIDLTDQSSIEGYMKTWRVKIDFKIDFEEQAETLYFRTSQRFLNEFRNSLTEEYQENSEIVVKYDIRFGAQDTRKTQMC